MRIQQQRTPDRDLLKWKGHISSLCMVGLVVIASMSEVCASDTCPRVIINEIQSSNSRTMADDDGHFEDWIELHNPTGDTISLADFGLTDDPGRLYRWVFPQGTSIEPHGFLLVWASGKNRRDAESPLHTNFSLRSTGEDVILSHFTIPEGCDSPVLDRIRPIAVPTDYSYGRYPDGADQWSFFKEPTPGKANKYPGYKGITSQPRFSHAPGFYLRPFELEVFTDDPEATIYYTLDGSEPTTDSPIYTKEISVSPDPGQTDYFSLFPTAPRFWQAPSTPSFKGFVVRAVAFKDGYATGKPSGGTWFVDPAGRSRYSFPVISMMTDEEHLFSDQTGIYVPGESYQSDNVYSGNYFGRGEEWERPAQILFWDEDVSVLGDPWQKTGIRSGFSQQVGVRIHGGATRRYPQKSLRIYARSIYDWNSEITYPLFPGLDKAGTKEPLNIFKRFVLRPSADDWFHTMFKDAMVQSLISDKNMDTQAYRPSVVFINGEYWGIHNIRERFDGWYVETNYGIHRDDVVILVDNADVNHGRPDDNQHYLNMREFVALKDMSEPENYQQVKTMMDIDNYLNYVSYQVYAANADWPHNNVRFWRKRTEAFRPEAPYGADGRWRWMVFDLDASFAFPYEGDQAWWSQYDHDMIAWITGHGNPRRTETWVNELFNGLIENEAFRNRFVSLLADDLNTRYMPEVVTNRIEAFRSRYQPEMEEHIDRNPHSAGGSLIYWESHVNRTIAFAEKRPFYVRKSLMDYFDIDSMHDLTLLTNRGDGYIRVNEVDIRQNTPGVHSPDSWTGTYFEGIPVRLEAVSGDAGQFTGWIINGQASDNPSYQGVDIKGNVIDWIPSSNLTVKAEFTGTLSVDEEEEFLPESFHLYQNYPNPFNHQTVISFDIPEAGDVEVRIYTVDGRLVYRSVHAARSTGKHEYTFRADGFATGIYLYQVTWNAANSRERLQQQRKMLHLR